MKGNEAYIEPFASKHGYEFTVRTGAPKDGAGAATGTKLARGANFRCVMSNSPITPEYIKSEGSSGRMGARLMAVVAEGQRGRVYLSPTPEMEAVAMSARPTWKPETVLPADMRSHWTPPYGLKTYGDLFTNRQLVALTTLAGLVGDARKKVKDDAAVAQMRDSGISLEKDGDSASAYSDAVAMYLAFVVSSLADRMSTICTWDAGGATWGTKTRNTFARQAIPMSWDFAEVNPLSTQSGSFENSLDYSAKGVVCVGSKAGKASQDEATRQDKSRGAVVSTDPPYYDNIGYADLSDFFYVWLRRSLRDVFPELFATLAVPKAEELVATPYRHGSKSNAEHFFLTGMTEAMHRLAEQAHPAFPVTIYYAFKQAETKKAGTASTGWETFLDAVIRAGFALTGTWPMRTELSNRMVGSGTNVLASSIVLVCRSREVDAATISRRELVGALKAELPKAVMHLQGSNIAPVDLAQAAIGPGMAIYTRYARVIDADGNPVTVRDALSLINQTLDEVLAEQEGDFDGDTRWALAWFDQQGFDAGDYGIAETLSKAKNTSVTGLVEAGILSSKSGKVRLLKPSELPANWDPQTDERLTIWEMVHHLVRILEADGEALAAKLVAKLGAKAEVARELAYRLYALCDRKKRAPLAGSYNGLVQSWPELSRLAREPTPPSTAAPQTELFAKK